MYKKIEIKNKVVEEKESRKQLRIPFSVLAVIEI